MESRQGLLSTAQAAGVLGVHPNTVRNWVDAGLLPVFRIGPRRDRRFLRTDIEVSLTAGTLAHTTL